MEVQVEIQFTVQHTLEQLRETFVKRGHIPEWHPLEGIEAKPNLFFEKRTITLPLRTEEDRYAWFIFSLESSGELRKRIVIPHVVPADVDLDNMDLKTFLGFCRHCLVGPVDQA